MLGEKQGKDRFSVSTAISGGVIDSPLVQTSSLSFQVNHSTMKSHGGLFSAFAVFAAGLPFHFGKIVKVLLSARQGAGQRQGPAVRLAALRQVSAPLPSASTPSAAGPRGAMGSAKVHSCINIYNFWK